MADDDNLTAQEQAQLDELLKGYGSPTQEEKHNVHTFLTAIARSKDTIKTGNLIKDELGFAQLPIRSLKEFEIYSKELCEDEIMANIFRAEAEVLTSTSLSKEGFLINRSVLSRKEITDPFHKPERKPNRSWFKKKEEPVGDTF